MATTSATFLAGVSAPLFLPAAFRRSGRDKLVVVAQADKSERWRPDGQRSYGGRRPDRGPRPSGRPKPQTITSESGMKLRQFVASDGVEHLGSALKARRHKPFPGPPPDEGPPLRILPIGGLGEIGMNCMLAGVRERYVVIDAGLMFPDFSDLGMQKILPDTDFLAQWKDRIEALIITHGHEDHIGALPWVVPALDRSTKVYASSFVMQLVKRRLTEYNLWDEERFVTFDMRQKFQAGPFEIEPVRVTHSIPDCCGLIMRSDEGTIVHTGDWKIDENPLDGEKFDRELFQALADEPVALMMSDSTNVLSPGRTLSETVVHDSIVEKVLEHNGRGRVICTQFASNLHRLYGVYRAAQAAGRKICFVGASLSHYLEAAWRDRRAPFDPKELMQPEQLRDADPNQVLIVTTGSQGEPRAQLSMAAKDSSYMLKIMPNDLLLYSAKVIPGNEGKVTKMLNALAEKGARVRQSRADNLHTSGHAYQEELVEVLQAVKPQHFLPVHGEYAFLTEHALLAKERAGIRNVDVIRNGEMLAVRERRNRNHVSSGSMAAATVTYTRKRVPRGPAGAEVSADRSRESDEDDGDGTDSMVKYDGDEPTYFFNDGGKGTGTREEMEIDMRSTMAMDGVVVIGVDVIRSGGDEFGLACHVRVTSRGLWTDSGRLLEELTKAVEGSVMRRPGTAALSDIERAAIDAAKRRCLAFNNKRPEVIAIAYEHDPRNAHLAEVAEARATEARRYNEGREDGPADSRDPRTRRGRANPWEAGSAGSSVGPAASGPGTWSPRRPSPPPSYKSAAAPAPPARRAEVKEDAATEEEEDGFIPEVRQEEKVEMVQEVLEEEAPAKPARAKRGRKTADAATAAAAAPEEATEDGVGGSVVAGPTSTLSKMLRTRKAAVSARQLTVDPTADATSSSGPPPLQPLDPRVIRERRKRNPRDHPSELNDPDYG